MLAILLVCAAPVIASYLAYYVFQPEGRTNYGALLTPLENVDGVAGLTPEGERLALGKFGGKWVMVTIDAGACARACEDKLYAMRQVRLTTGKDRDRIERVLLLADDVALADRIRREHEGMHVARVAPEALSRAFPPQPGGDVADHIFIVDPLGNLVMRFPKNADPNRMKKDIARLLRASRIG